MLQKYTVQTLHGTLRTHEEQTYFITYHPAGGIRLTTIKKRLEDDFVRLDNIIH